MRELNIACANSRSTKQLTNKKIELSALKGRLKVTIRTTESAEEYARLPRSKRDAAKDHGGIVAGVLKDGRRKIDTVVSRSMVTLDGDRIEAEFLEDYERRVPYTSILQHPQPHAGDAAGADTGSPDEGCNAGGVCGGGKIPGPVPGHGLF